ncbi:MAG: FtsX-like permease family protein [Oscillospiraceae bacterium]
MKTINKNIFREISKSKGRFMSILLICAIGVGFFSGVKATGNDMKISADNFYDKQQLFDLRVMSTFGLTEDDAAAIAEIDGVTGVFTSKYSDMALLHHDKEYMTRVYSWNDNAVNKIVLREGRLPQNETECLISGNKLKSVFEVGDTISLEDRAGADEFPLKYSEYTIVGTFDTPMYISMTQKGSTTIGDGALDAFMYVTESNFTQDIYTEIYVTSENLKAMQSYSDEYTQLCDEISDRLEELGTARSEIRYDEVVGEALQEIEDGEEELIKAKADGEKELAEAKSEIDDAEKKIIDGEKELSEAKAELDDGAKQLEEAEQQLKTAADEIEKGKSELIDAKTELNNAEAEIIKGKAELDKGKKELEEAKAQLDENKAKLSLVQTEIDEKAAELLSGREQLDAAKAQLAQSEEEYNAGVAQYEQGMYQLEQGKMQLENAIAVYGEYNPEVIQLKAELAAMEEMLNQTKLQLDGAKAQLDLGAEELAANEALLTDGEAQLGAAKAEIEAAWKLYNDGEAEYLEGQKKFEQAQLAFLEGYEDYLSGMNEYSAGLDKIEQAQIQYDEGAAEISEKRAEYEDGVKQYEAAVQEIEDAKLKLSDGKKEYEDGLAEFNREIADAQKELDDAREKIKDAGQAKWYVFRRDDNPGYAEYSSNADRIDKIAAIFPVFFLLVAGLVCLTTMSRMVEENRTQVGTLKALGYSNGRIMLHYMAYALIAAVIGSVFGALGGMVIFPNVIMYAYSIMYIIEEVYCEFSLFNIMLSAGSMLAAIAVTVFFSCNKVLSETPASLMRPKAPKAGKRVLLERIGFIWNRMGFFAKVSGRNLFRYKRRMLMTVIGIAGCTALMVTGFGLKNSVSDIIDLQYGEIYQYSGYIAVEDDMSAEKQQALYDSLLEYESQTVYTPALIKQYSVSSEKSNVQAYVTAAENSAVLEGMIDLHERTTGKKLSISDGAIITEKLAKLLSVREGDTIQIMINDREKRDVTVSGITEHYASHYVYLTEELYSAVFGYAPDYNIVYFTNGMSNDDATAEEFSTMMMSCDGVLSVILNSASSNAFSDMLGMIDLVIIVLIISAGALAFVVLYNLTNVNITERIREIATLKVLGFYDSEVAAYVFRENIILSVLGGLAGLLLGVFLCGFVVQTAEIDEVMFGRTIHATSFVFSFVITIAFSLAVNLIMTATLKKISMVESLKSIE